MQATMFKLTISLNKKLKILTITMHNIIKFSWKKRKTFQTTMFNLDKFGNKNSKTMKKTMLNLTGVFC